MISNVRATKVYWKRMLEKLRKKPKLLQKLDEGEKLWVKEQNTLPEEKLKRDAEKANHHMLYLQSLLAKC